MIPGSNLLLRAHKLIGFSSFQYFAFVSRAAGSTGLDVGTYAKVVNLQGSVQPVPRVMYEKLGLNLQKNYYTVYVAKNVIDVARDVSGDQIVFNGTKLQCESVTKWFAIDGWTAIICVEVV